MFFSEKRETSLRILASTLWLFSRRKYPHCAAVILVFLCARSGCPGQRKRENAHVFSEGSTFHDCDSSVYWTLFLVGISAAQSDKFSVEAEAEAWVRCSRVASYNKWVLTQDTVSGNAATGNYWRTKQRFISVHVASLTSNLLEGKKLSSCRANVSTSCEISIPPSIYTQRCVFVSLLFSNGNSVAFSSEGCSVNSLKVFPAKI